MNKTIQPDANGVLPVTARGAMRLAKGQAKDKKASRSTGERLAKNKKVVTK